MDALLNANIDLNYIQIQNNNMTKEEIDNVVCKIMTIDGPDRHVDGHDVITDFIVALLEGREYDWKKKYWYENDIYNAEW